jgi:hypothetical protein
VAPSSGLAKVGSRAAQMKLDMAQKGQISPTFEADSQAREETRNLVISMQQVITSLEDKVMLNRLIKYF